MGITARKILRDRDTLTFLFVDVIVGTVVGVVSWLANDDAASALLWAMGATALLWIITIRVQLGLQRFDLEDRLDALQRGLEASVEIKLRALADDDLAADLRAIAAGASASCNSLDEPFRSFVRTSLHDYARTMKAVESGSVVAPSDVAWFWALDFIKKSKEIFATTFSSRLPFWSSQAGRQYMAANKEAAARGAKITRVFILDGYNDERLIDDVVAEHINANMDVWIVRAQDLEPAKIIDLAAFDGAVVSIWESSRPDSDIEDVTWSSSEESIARYRAIKTYYSYRSQKIEDSTELESWRQSLTQLETS